MISHKWVTEAGMGTWLKIAPACCVLALVGVGCGSDGGENSGETASQAPPVSHQMESASAQTAAPGANAVSDAPIAGTGGTATEQEPAGATNAPAAGGMGQFPAGDPAPAVDPGGPAGATDPGMMPAANGMAAMMGPDTEVIPPLADGQFPDPRGGCNLDTGFPGDDQCMLPPPEGEGMQIHVGPESYDSPGEFVVTAGTENSVCVNIVTPNLEDVYYQGWTLAGRPGTHHIINTMYSTPNSGGGTTLTACRDGGTGTAANIIANLPGASKAYMPRAPVAPENANVGAKIPGGTHAQADMHYFNPTDGELLREFWLNLYFVPKEKVMEESHGIRAMGGLSWIVAPIPPGTDQVYKYECPITSSGRIIQLLGHYHAHGVQFTSHLRRASGERVKVFEMFDYEDPAIFYYNSVTKNPEFGATTAGATSGMLEVNAGDVIEWECHIVNDSQVGLRYSNEVERGEMCNLWGASIGPTIDCVVF